MIYLNSSLKKYFDDLSAKLPAPGGGSACAVTGVLGVSLLSMVANFTVGKEQYKSVEEEIKKIGSELNTLRNRIELLVDEDVAAYQKVSAAYKLPKTTDEEKNVREKAVQESVKTAMQVPKEVLELSCCGINIARRLVDIGNVNLVSDVGVGILFLDSAVKGAKLNIEINLAGIKDKEFVEIEKKFVEDMMKDTDRLVSETVKLTEQKILS